MKYNLFSRNTANLKRRNICEEVFAHLTDVTLADEDANSILADNAKRAIQGNEAMQIM